MTDWSRLAKLAGMLGSPHDGERLNAARLLQAALDKEGVSFGDLAQRIEHGGESQGPRMVVVEKRANPNPAAYIARKILARTNDGHSLTASERRFLRGIVRNADMTDGNYELSTQQANWLTMLQENWMKPRMKMAKPRKPPGPVPQSMLDELGLGEPPKPRRPQATHTKPRNPDIMPDARGESFERPSQTAWAKRELDLDDDCPF